MTIKLTDVRTQENRVSVSADSWDQRWLELQRDIRIGAGNEVSSAPRISIARR
jgi:hypothetical protein